MADKDKGPVEVGAAAGAVGGGVVGAIAAGAAAGGMAGPVGALVGAVEGAVVGAITGALSSKPSPLAEEAYWRERFPQLPYVAGASFDDYGPAFLYGAESFLRYSGRAFQEVEPELGRGWRAASRGSTLDWNRARIAAGDAWLRLQASRSVDDEIDRSPRS